jgi:hypothetical protein
LKTSQSYIDEWGRPIPDPNRWPSSKNGQGFKPVSDKVHSLGLQFGFSSPFFPHIDQESISCEESRKLLWTRTLQSKELPIELEILPFKMLDVPGKTHL